MELYYRSTRDPNVKVTASQAILQGLSRDGGLFVPERIPALETDPDKLAGMNYREIAYDVMRLFLTDFSGEELRRCIESAYDEKFDVPQIAPLHRTGNVWYMELFHGRTIAFKDMALSILPYLMTTAAAKNAVTDEIVILDRKSVV